MHPLRMNAVVALKMKSRALAQLKMPCPLCSRCHGPPGELDGTAYSDEKDRLLLDKLFKFRRTRAGAYEVRLLPVGASGRALPRDIQMFANTARVRYPQGVLVAHEEIRASFVSRCGQMHQLVRMACGARPPVRRERGGLRIAARRSNAVDKRL